MKLIICNSKSWFKLDEKLISNLEVLMISKKDELNYDLIYNYNPDYIFFIHWNWRVKKEIYSNFECIVFHTAPLPYGRGGSPIQNLILNGYKRSPVCALRMEKELDAGPIYSLIEISLEGSLKEIFSRVNIAVNQLIQEIIKNNLIPKAQKGNIKVFDRLNYEDNKIPLNLHLKTIFDYIRMVDDGEYENSYIIYGDTKLEFFNAKYQDKAIICNCRISKCN